MGIVLGLKSPQSFDLLGADYPDEDIQLKLRKWSKGRQPYKNEFVHNAARWLESEEFLYGAEVADEMAIRLAGGSYLQKHFGPFPQPSSLSSKGRPRVMMGGYEIDDKTIPPHEVLRDDLCVLGWFASALESLRIRLEGMNNGLRVKLGVLIDNLPNEQDGNDNHKATLLKLLLLKASGEMTTVIGIPESSDELQRDRMVHNLAGLRREIGLGTWSGEPEAIELFRFDRKNLGGGVVLREIGSQ